MKKASEILSHISNQPQFRYLKKHECFRKYLHLLPNKWKQAIAFVYIKNKILFIAVKHPVFKTELNYNKDLLTSLLSQLKTYVDGCKELDALQVEIFVTYKQEEKEKEDTVPYYHEMATGEFEIDTNQEELRAKFQEIKTSIEKNR
jgi:hypothetical protein